MIYAQYNIIMYSTVTIMNLLPYVFAAPKGNIAHLKDVTKNTNLPGFLETIFMSSFSSRFVEDVRHTRVKRQVGSGAGKYVDAAKMPQIKILRLYLQAIKNLFAESPIGGAGPFDPDSVKPVLYLFKDKIIQFFFPDPRQEHADVKPR